MLETRKRKDDAILLEFKMRDSEDKAELFDTVATAYRDEVKCELAKRMWEALWERERIEITGYGEASSRTVRWGICGWESAS